MKGTGNQSAWEETAGQAIRNLQGDNGKGSTDNVIVNHFTNLRRDGQKWRRHGGARRGKMYWLLMILMPALTVEGLVS